MSIIYFYHFSCSAKSYRPIIVQINLHFPVLSFYLHNISIGKCIFQITGHIIWYQFNRDRCIIAIHFQPIAFMIEIYFCSIGQQYFILYSPKQFAFYLDMRFVTPGRYFFNEDLAEKDVVIPEKKVKLSTRKRHALQKENVQA